MYNVLLSGIKRLAYSEEKNRLIQRQHGISFEEVIDALEEKRIVAAFPNPNRRKYPNQVVVVVEIRRYAYVVPTVEGEESIFLKTAFPSRKYTKKYLKKKKGVV